MLRKELNFVTGIELHSDEDILELTRKAFKYKMVGVVFAPGADRRGDDVYDHRWYCQQLQRSFPGDKHSFCEEPDQQVGREILDKKEGYGMKRFEYVVFTKLECSQLVFQKSTC